MLLLLKSGKPRLLDLFCGAGGASMGYHRAGFEVTGVDIAPQKRYPFTFIQDNALEYLYKHGWKYDFIHASPPCQGYTSMNNINPGKKAAHPMLIKPVRELLQYIGKPYVIENVEGAKKEMVNPLRLCGTMFGLRVLRHRLFETKPEIYFPPHPCCHTGKCNGFRDYGTLDKFDYITITSKRFRFEDGKIAMGIDWMSLDELTESIPPAYTEWIGRQLLGQPLVRAA